MKLAEDAQQRLDDMMKDEWYQTRPEAVQAAIRATPPVILYQFKDSKKQCYVIGYDEDTQGPVTLIVMKTGIGGPLAQIDERLALALDNNQVFNVKPEDLEPWEGPEDAN